MPLFFPPNPHVPYDNTAFGGSQSALTARLLQSGCDVPVGDNNLYSELSLYHDVHLKRVCLSSKTNRVSFYLQILVCVWQLR